MHLYAWVVEHREGITIGLCLLVLVLMTLNDIGRARECGDGGEGW